jgi:3-oxoacyl-[acyl-carrier protein] reductase
MTTPDGSSLRGHVALVTGSNRNIGRAIVLALAERGCDVVINARRHADEAEAVAASARARGVNALVALGDVGRPEGVDAVVRRALGEFPRVDVIVNNAAIRPEAPFLEMTAAQWHEVMDVDLHAAFYTAKAFLPGMVEQRWGRIVSLAGMNALQGYGGRAHVSAAKHGVWGLTKALAREFGPHGITVNAISPGPIEPEDADSPHAAHIRSQLGRIPVGRLGTAADIATMCAHLCSPEAGFTSGQMIAINGAAQT